MQSLQESLLTNSFRGEIIGTCNYHVAAETDYENPQIQKFVQLVKSRISGYIHYLQTMTDPLALKLNFIWAQEAYQLSHPFS